MGMVRRHQIQKKEESEVTLSCLTLFEEPRECSPQAPLSVSLQARVLEWVPSQRIFLAHGSNLGFLHCSQMLYHPSHHGTRSKEPLDSISFQPFVKLLLALPFYSSSTLLPGLSILICNMKKLDKMTLSSDVKESGSEILNL